MGKVAKKGYENKNCPRCQTERYFDGNECLVCHFTFTAVELEQKQELFPRLREGEFLCDTCMYDWRSYRHPERPNAKFCVDYKRK